MDGGGADALGANCDPVDSSCPDLVDAVDQATALLTQMATDGVEQVVYAFYPDPTDSALRQKLDALRTRMEAVCICGSRGRLCSGQHSAVEDSAKPCTLFSAERHNLSCAGPQVACNNTGPEVAALIAVGSGTSPPS
jgi:hypothetical protein